MKETAPRLGFSEQIKQSFAARKNRRNLERLSLRAARESRPHPSLSPVLFFNASTRLGALSQNAAFSYLASLALQSAGLPVVHFGCRAGMGRCVMGTVRSRPQDPPPCKKCVALSEVLYAHAPVVWFKYEPDETMQRALDVLDVDSLSQFEIPFEGETLPLGELVTPSLRWALRRYDLEDDEATRFFLRQYLLSAEMLAREYAALLDRLQPGCTLIFNGILYPEAITRWVAQQRGVRAITYEVAFQPFSAFFSDELAPRYPVQIPPDWQLSPDQNQRLDEHLEQRFMGQFTMAGIRFWPEMHALEETFAQGFRQVVPIFTNVIYDTSQVGTNLTFEHMFAWLDHLLPVIRAHPETLFVLRAHPDEMRPGKESRQSVHMWVQANHVAALPNVLFIPSREFISSYELIRRSKFVLVYNSSVGLEATLLGIPVVCAAQARYTQIPIVHFPQTPLAYRQLVEEMLTAGRVILPDEFAVNARRFLYYQLFRASLPFGDFIEAAPRPGFVQLRHFHLEDLHPDRCAATRVILEGILEDKPFLLPE